MDTIDTESELNKSKNNDNIELDKKLKRKEYMKEYQKKYKEKNREKVKNFESNKYNEKRKENTKKYFKKNADIVKLIKECYSNNTLIINDDTNFNKLKELLN